MEFDAFSNAILRRLDIDYELVPLPTTGLFDELELDSLAALEMLILIESLAALDVPPIDMPMMLTLGDAYDYYQYAVSLADDEQDG